MAVDWGAEEAKIKARWQENQNEIDQTAGERDEIVARYDQRLSVLYTEGVNLNGEARFARRMKAEQEARRAERETQSAETTGRSSDAPESATTAAEDDAASEPEATTDTPSPESIDIPEFALAMTSDSPLSPEEPEAA